MQNSRTSLLLDHAGVDVGFFATKYTLGRVSTPGTLGSTIAAGSFPSVAARASAMPQRAGTGKLDGVVVQAGQQHYFVGASAPNLIGSSGLLRSASDSYCTTDTYLSLFKGALWHIARHHRSSRSLQIGQLVVGLPLSTVTSFDKYVEGLCGGVHQLPSPYTSNETISVEVKKVLVVAQPQGAVINFQETLGVGMIQPHHETMVLDLGGGTFDWYVCKGDYQPRFKLCGATNIGTLNCSTAVCRSIKASFASSPIALARVDTALCTGAESFEIGGTQYQTCEHWPTVEAIVYEAVEQMQNQVGDLESLDHVILTGGGAPLLKKTFDSKLPHLAARAKMDPDPVFGNVRGFHRISEFFAYADQS